MKRETARWVRKAEADFQGARRLAEGKPALHDLICFHCQQAAEKYLKALLQDFGLAVPRIHDLENLLLSLLPHDPSLKKLGRSLAALTPFAVDYRYPGDSATKRDAQAALRRTDRVRQEIRRRLGLQP
jgi:HEPN domain-containing protein